jgi:hypothetical protein
MAYEVLSLSAELRPSRNFHSRRMQYDRPADRSINPPAVVDRNGSDPVGLVADAIEAISRS